MDIYKGKIKSFSGSFGSGLGFLNIEDSNTGKLISVPCENGATVRALDAAFGDVITAGHTANGGGLVDKEIFWSYDDMGLVLGGFSPVEEATEELIELYENQKPS